MRKSSSRDTWFYVAMVAPAVIVYLVIIAFPILSSVVLGFTDYNILQPQNAHFVGLKHYGYMFNDDLFWKAFNNNMFVVAVSVFGQIPIGFILAYILFRKMVKGEGFFQTMIFLPNFLTTIVIGILWNRIFGSPGPVESIMKAVSGNPNAMITWGFSQTTAMIPIGFVLIWMYTGLYMVIFLANLQKIDVGLIEAAQIDGASEPKIFIKIIVPLLSGVILVNAILAIAGSLKGFDLIWAMTKGGPANNTMILPLYMYNFAFAAGPSQFGFGSAISNMLVFISLALIGLSSWIGKKFNAGEDY